MLVALWSFAALVAGCAAPPAPQQIGILMFSDARVPQVSAFIDELKTLGYEPGRNLKVQQLNADGDVKQLRGMSERLTGEKLDLLVATGGLEADAIKAQVEAAHSNVPVLALYVNAVIERKFIADRRQPGWNVTGVDNLNAELSGKRVELLTELLPDLKRLLILYHPNIEPSTIGLAAARDEAVKRGVEVVDRPVTNADEIRAAMAALSPGDVDAMLLVPTAQIDSAFHDEVLPQAERLKLPIMTHARPLAQDGALASYAAPSADVGRQGARLAQKILTGTPASDMPFEVPSKFKYTINRKTLTRLGLELNPLVRGQVTEFIE